MIKLNSFIPANITSCSKLRDMTDTMTSFTSSEIPTINIIDSIKIINKCIPGNHRNQDSVWIATFIILTRFIDKKRTIITVYIVHRLVITSLLIAIKISADVTRVNRALHIITGLELDDLQEMEEVFLLSLDWGVYINIHTYKQARNYMVSWIHPHRGAMSMQTRICIPQKPQEMSKVSTNRKNINAFRHCKYN